MPRQTEIPARARLDARRDVALQKSGARVRTLVHNDGATERRRQPRLAGWEVPLRDPAEDGGYL